MRKPELFRGACSKHVRGQHPRHGSMPRFHTCVHFVSVYSQSPETGQVLGPRNSYMLNTNCQDSWRLVSAAVRCVHIVILQALGGRLAPSSAHRADACDTRLRAEGCRTMSPDIQLSLQLVKDTTTGVLRIKWLHSRSRIAPSAVWRCFSGMR